MSVPPPTERDNVQPVEHHQIGRVAERTGLSLRTIRYYEEAGLARPSGRTEGGFRLYTDADIDRLDMIKALKPIGLSLETMAELLTVADQLMADPPQRAEMEAAFVSLLQLVDERCDDMEKRLVAARAAHAALAARVSAANGAHR